MDLSYNRRAKVVEQLRVFVKLGKYALGKRRMPPNTYPITPDLAISRLLAAQRDGSLRVWATTFAETLSTYRKLIDDLATGKVKEADVERAMIREALEGLSACL